MKIDRMEKEILKQFSHEIEAEIYYLRHEEGGRSTPVYSGYRGQFFYDGRDWDAPQEFIDKSICSLGESVQVRMTTLSPMFHAGKLRVGKEFEIREGGKTIGLGKITRIIKKDFQYWDYATFSEEVSKGIISYNEEEIKELINIFQQNLGQIKEFKKIHIEQRLSNLSQMLLIECWLVNRNEQLRPLIDKIYDFWQSDKILSNSYFKIEVNLSSNYFEFELIFAIHSNKYLTGKIKIKRNE